MKKSKVERAVITALLAGLIGTPALAKDNKQNEEPLAPVYSDCPGMAAAMPSKTICKPDAGGRHLVFYCQYRFTYDEQQRVTRKEVYRWNVSDECWGADHALSFSYEEGRIVAEYAAWDKRKKTFGQPVERAVYTKSDAGVTAYTAYRRSPSSEDWMQVVDLSGLQPNGLWLEMDELASRMLRRNQEITPN